MGGSVVGVSSLTDSLDMKVKELLKEVQLQSTSSFTKLVDDTVAAIKAAVDQIPEDLQVTSDLAPGFVKDIGADKIDFKFKRPTHIEVGGSYSIQGIAKPDVSVDVFVRMPKDCFLRSDYLNHRYFAKRCLYLCIIKKYLGPSSLLSKVEWSSLQNEARKPVLVVYPAAKVPEVPGFSVRIIPTATSMFDIGKLNLKRSNIRALTQEGTPEATPNYNSSILEDMCMEENAEFVNRTFQGWKELTEALILLKVWAQQRNCVYVYDCLNGFLIAIILAYLANQAKINKSMKPMQIFRVTLDFIATSKLWKRGLYLQVQGENRVSKEERLNYVDLFPVVICNTSHLNLAFRMSEHGFLELQEEASLTLKCMEKCRDSGFEEIFITKIDDPAKFDLCIRLNLSGNEKVSASGFCLDNECWRVYERKIQKVLSQGLSDRVKIVRVTWINVPLGYSVENGLSTLDRDPLFIGISISSIEKAFRVVDIGPNAENKEEALKFRKFWGEKAELRQFKDGKIAESTVWESEQWARHLIMKRMTEYMLLRHFSLSKEHVIQFVDQLDFSLLHGTGDPISYSGSLLQAFDVLSKRLRLLEDIPLKVSSVQPLDSGLFDDAIKRVMLDPGLHTLAIHVKCETFDLRSAFRSASVSPPEPHPLIIEKGRPPRHVKFIPSCVRPLDIMIQLEGSGNWPIDDAAIEKTKSAFLIKIGESLENDYGMTCTATEDSVNILMSGFAFRLKILHERGLSLLKQENGNNMLRKVSSEDKRLFIRGQHSSMINGLQGRYGIYGSVVRLAKRWVASHLFSACLAEEAVELLVAHLFLKPFPFSAPCSRISGFLRFLRLLTDYNWTFSPLIVDINNDLAPEDEKEIQDNFMESRRVYDKSPLAVNPAMFLGTAYDKASEAWTRSSPSHLELKRLVAYARSSANLLTKLMLHDQSDAHRWECLFKTPLNNYDAVILVHRDRLPYPENLLFPSEVNQGRHVANGKPSKAFHPSLTQSDLKGGRLEEIKSSRLMVDFDPLRCFLGDLEKEFPDTFKTWYDSLGGDAIGLTWERSNTKKKREREEGGDEGEEALDVLKSVGELGKGFVRSVYLLKAPRL